jgi:hypothetical protein
MRHLESRLSALEDRLHPKPPPVMRGTYELHYTEAWPDCLNFLGKDYHHCTEHGPNCAAIITPVYSQVRRQIILKGAKAGLDMGLD